MAKSDKKSKTPTKAKAQIPSIEKAKLREKKSDSGRIAGSKADKKRSGLESKRVVAELVEEDDLESGTESSDNGDSNADSNPDRNPDGNPDIYQNLPSESEVEELARESLPIAKTKALATSDPVASYMAEIRKYPLLTREQESELAKKYFETKDPQAAQALVTANLRFVVKVALDYSRFGARLIDLVQEGNMGLMHAVRDFNPYKGVRLITYAVWWIRGYIQEYLMKQYSLVKIGTTQNQKKLFYQLQKQKEALEAMGEPGSIALLSSRLNIPEEEVKMMTQRMSGRDVSLSQTIGDDSSASLMDFQKSASDSPDEQLSKHEEIQNLHEAVAAIRPHLSAREIIILEERIMNDEPLTLQEIGDKHGITREAVRQMEVRVIKKIKDHFLQKNQTAKP